MLEIMQDVSGRDISPYKSLCQFIKIVGIGDVRDLREFCEEP